jgi:hypothetical protein
MRTFLFCSLALVLVVGCGPKRDPQGTVTGKVTYKGQPVNGGTLKLYKIKGTAGDDILIPLSQEGTYSSADVPEGDYIVVVEPLPAHTPKTTGKTRLSDTATTGTIPIPKKYLDRKDSSLSMTVKPGNQKIDLELTD